MPPIGTSNSSSSSLGQLSLRHIPDISDTLNEDGSTMCCDQSSMQLETSFSIQITGVGSNTLLADEDAENFFGGTDADMSIDETKSFQRTKIQQTLEDEEAATNDVATPRASSRKSSTIPPLEIRSEPEVELMSSIPFPSPPFKNSTRSGSPLEDSFTIIPSATSPASPRNRQQNEPQANDEYLAPSTLRSPKIKQPQVADQSSIQKNGLPVEVPTHPSKGKPALRNKQKIIEGGIAKSKLPSKKVASTAKEVNFVAKPEARSSKPAFTRQASSSKISSVPKVPLKADDLLPVDTPSFADASSSSIISQRGVAARLMQYGKEYMADLGQTLSPDTSLLVDTDQSMNPLPPPLSQLGGAGLPAANLSTEVEINTSGLSNTSSPKVISTQDGLGADNQHSDAKEHDNTLLLATARTSASSEHVYSLPQARDEEMDTSIPEDDRDGPLTLSQLSPRKRAAAMISKPLSRKRMFPTDDEHEENRKPRVTTNEEGPKMKKSKNNDSTSKETRKPGLVSRPRVPSTRAAASTIAGPSRTRARSGTVTGPRKAANMTGSGFSGVSSSSMNPIAEAAAVAANGSTQPTGESKPDARPPAREVRKNRRVVSASSVNNERKPTSRTVIPAFNPAVGWNDDVHMKKAEEDKETRRLKDSRLVNNNAFTDTSIDDKARPMTRSHTRSQSQNVRLGNYHPAPNFKAIHEAFNESLASRKATFHPTVPIEMQWETDARIEQRRKFDEQVKEKEREKERLEEEMRKKREQEEKQEVRELRKKLVVKANEVPEWYRDVPRKMKDEVGGI
ncbi:hypothetical protein CPB83DRAFT_883743 [Crepidotus variabilis]|uniref:TPX2 C-terminal domain-containing protein n=1 Tax=Crepidotus variabilis TaxID=179855 RepID=A0A9P6EG68_9AGAR|nr:hypothetical protein CPB83DRAFT_883743 [Crepidotus variabilis]